MARGLRIVVFGAFGFGCLVGALESAVLLTRSPDIRLVDPAAELLAVLGRYGVVAAILACGARLLRPRWTPSKQTFTGVFLLLFGAVIDFFEGHLPSRKEVPRHPHEKEDPRAERGG